MIVFTATSVHSDQVFVGTARESVEEEWASLMSQAEADASGDFFDLLRRHGTAAFEVEVWAFADSPGEARESMREAREELGAEAIKSSRGSAGGAVPAKSSKSSAAAVKALLASLAEEDGPVDDDELFEAADWRSTSSTEDAAREGVTDASPEPSSPAASTAAVADASYPDGSAGRDDGEDEELRLQQRIAMMKAAQARLLQERDTRPQGGSPAPAAAPAAKLAEGRTGSASKERRIREAIAEERERREAQSQRRTQEQYAEMRDVLARIELRRIQTRRENTEKAKVARSRQLQAERQQKAEREQLQRNKAAATDSAAAASQVTARSQAARPVLSRTPAAAPPAAAPAAAPSEAAQELAGRGLKGGSAAREKRIREAIAQERADREMRQSRRRAVEADEMAEMLRRLEERTKAADKYKRRL